MSVLLFRDIYVRINQLLSSKLPHAAYALTDSRRLPDTAGWTVYDPQAEFTRLGFRPPKTSGMLNGFRLTHINSNYKLSATYPNAFIVPAAISDGEIRKMSYFRARGRVPAITYRHKNDAMVARCAQPLVGLRRKRCAADEAFITALKRECSGKLLFIDCRSQVNMLVILCRWLELRFSQKLLAATDQRLREHRARWRL